MSRITKREPYEVVLSRLQRKKSDSTYREYERHIRQFREWAESNYDITIFEAGPIEIEEMVDAMLEENEKGRRYSASSINVRRAALSEFYKEARRLDGERIDVAPEGQGFKNPLDSVPPLSAWDSISTERKKSDVPYLMSDQVDALANHVQKPTVRNELLIRLAAQTGLRRGELVRLKLDDGTWTKDGQYTSFSPGRPRRITVRPEVAKNGEKRVVGWNSTLDFTLKRWIQDYRPTVAMAAKSDYLFPSNRSEHISGQAFNDVVREAADRAGIQDVNLVNRKGEKRHKVTTHILRHTFAMSCISEDWDIYALSEAMGHSSVAVTENNYLHDAEEVVMSHFRDNAPSFTGTE